MTIYEKLTQILKIIEECSNQDYDSEYFKIKDDVIFNEVYKNYKSLLNNIKCCIENFINDNRDALDLLERLNMMKRVFEYDKFKFEPGIEFIRREGDNFKYEIYVKLHKVLGYLCNDKEDLNQLFKLHSTIKSKKKSKKPIIEYQDDIIESLKRNDEETVSKLLYKEFNEYCKCEKGKADEFLDKRFVLMLKEVKSLLDKEELYGDINHILSTLFCKNKIYELLTYYKLIEYELLCIPNIKWTYDNKRAETDILIIIDSDGQIKEFRSIEVTTRKFLDNNKINTLNDTKNFLNKIRPTKIIIIGNTELKNNDFTIISFEELFENNIKDKILS